MGVIIHIHAGCDGWGIGGSCIYQVTILKKGIITIFRILMLRDSFASPVGVFMSQVCGQCDLLWTQRYGSGEIKKLLQEQHYDYVIVSVYPENLSFKNFPYYESRGEAR